MMDVILIHPTPEGSEEIQLDRDSLSFGRGSEADYRFDDDGLSRLHATIYRDGDNLWVVDENSTNGTFVNGERVHGRGTPLENGDTVRIGNYTDLKVRFKERQGFTENVSTATQTTQTVSSSTASSAPKSLSSLLPVALIGIAFFVISISAAFIIIKSIAKEKPPISQNTNEEEDPPETPEGNENSGVKPPKTKTPRAETPQNSSPGNENSGGTIPPEETKTPIITLPPGKKYLEFSDEDKKKYVESRLRKIASIVGNRASEEIPQSAIIRIKQDVDGYANRIKSNNAGKACPSSLHGLDGLQVTFERASKNTWFISRAYSQEGIEPQVGIYIAMIESEHCPCVQSGTGPLGMFQFTYGTAVTFFEKSARIVKGSSPPNGDDRCNPEVAARGSASYVKYLMGWYGTGPASLPLAIAGYNSGEGMLRKNLKIALDSDPSLSRDFWTLIANSDKLTEQFRLENFKYPPKFFAAAIVGENPQDFGLNLQPLSTYTNK
jgi:pSer/pThr/pTyr-binding forkhead associated (FHA) protein